MHSPSSSWISMIVNLPNRILLAKVERVFVVVGEHIVAALLILLKQKKIMYVPEAHS
jgi:hypothetical protein